MPQWANSAVGRGTMSMHTYLESLVCIEVQRHPRVREEEVQAAKVEQVIAAHLPGKGFHGPGVLHRIQQHHLQQNIIRLPFATLAEIDAATSSGNLFNLGRK